MNRYEKYEWLNKVCTEKFMKEEFVLELLHYMGEDDFNEFYDRLCRLWDIVKSPEELENMVD